MPSATPDDDARVMDQATQDHRAGRLEQAELGYRETLRRAPGHVEASHLLGLLLAQRGELEPGIALLRAAVQRNSQDHRYRYNLGRALWQAGRLDDAEAALRAAMALAPQSPEILNHLGRVLYQLGKYGEAVALARRALASKPNFGSAHNHLAMALARQGRVAEAVESYRDALRCQPDSCGFGSNLLFTLHYLPAIEPAGLLAEHRTWAERHATPLRASIKAHENDPSPDRRLRIGYLSPNFRDHPISFFIEPIFESHDRMRVEVFAYFDHPRRDAVTERLRALTDVWRETHSLADDQLADLIRQDQIDILIDLTLHMDRNRMLVFARKPAPVQMSYLAYPATTGLDTIDYKLSDSHLDPPGEDDSFHTERILHLPQSYYCYHPDPASPPTSPLPARRTGQITFASVNTLMKISPACIAAWSRILAALPDSRLIVQARGLGDSDTRDHLRAQFVAAAADPKRIALRPQAPFDAFLKLFDEVDIALDAFPFSSGTTTCHTLWMGVPVITLAGKMAVHRMGYSVLVNAGLSELGAFDIDGYVNKATELASDTARLAELRRGMRDRLRRSPLLDAARLASDLERLYRRAWHDWCSRIPTSG
jgi:predicted O-linked N-acetylglucosamine transferase (SPINDLY family)